MVEKSMMSPVKNISELKIFLEFLIISSVIAVAIWIIIDMIKAKVNNNETVYKLYKNELIFTLFSLLFPLIIILIELFGGIQF
jgi:hypothetical protein